MPGVANSDTMCNSQKLVDGKVWKARGTSALALRSWLPGAQIGRMDLAKYTKYIENTKRVPLPVEMFDEDWEPIGPTVRRDLVAAGLVVEEEGGLRLVAR